MKTAVIILGTIALFYTGIAQIVLAAAAMILLQIAAI